MLEIADFVRVKIRRSPHIRLYRSPGRRALAGKGAVCGTVGFHMQGQMY
jgi:hypothetical protein